MLCSKTTSGFNKCLQVLKICCYSFAHSQMLVKGRLTSCLLVQKGCQVGFLFVFNQRSYTHVEKYLDFKGQIQNCGRTVTILRLLIFYIMNCGRCRAQESHNSHELSSWCSSQLANRKPQRQVSFSQLWCIARANR